MRPIEWLLNLSQQRGGYARLLSDSGGLAAAAWRLAEARCQTRETATAIPTKLEVRAAARTLSAKLSLGHVPSSLILATDCERQGLLVL